ncbi:hypothetical protein N665_0138s0019 [Sinapis alba]|nr:hypothetical protein N665_0138s0019 [Sinapis alba]
MVAESAPTVEGEDTQTVVTQSQKLKGSWVSAVEQGQSNLKKYDVEVSIKDGVQSVDVPEEVFIDAAPLWEDILIGKFLDKAPHIAKIHAIVNKIWTEGDKSQTVEVFPINATTMKFRICNPSVRGRILLRGMWNLAEVPVIMSKWSPFPDETQKETKAIPMWVHMKNVPISMFSWKGLSFVASPVGEPKRLHPETAQCLNMKVAKFFVIADLTKELPRSMKFNYQGKETMVDFIYPWLPAKCSNCNKWGHMEKACLVGKNQTNVSGENQIVTINVDLEKKREVGNEKEKETELVNENEVVTDLEKGEQTGDTQERDTPSIQTNERSIENVEVETHQRDHVSQNEAGWSTVSPGKACRSPENTKQSLEYGQVSILSNSRFSVLSSEEEGEIMEQEEQNGTVEISDKLDVEPPSSNVMKKDEEHSHEVEKESEIEIIQPRKSLPRNLKTNHKFILENSVQKTKDGNPSTLSKANSRKHY